MSDPDKVEWHDKLGYFIAMIAMTPVAIWLHQHVTPALAAWLRSIGFR